MRKGLFGVGLVCCCVLLTGCWNRVEINDLGISIAAAIDQAPKNQVRFSEQIALPGKMSGGKGSTLDNKPYYTFSGVGKDVTDAIQNLQVQLSRRLFLAHRRVFLIGEKLAAQDIRDFLDEVSRNPQSRLRTSVAVTRGEAYRYLQVQYPFEHLPAEGLRKLLFGVSSNYTMDLKELAIMLATPGSDAMIPIVELQSPSPGNKPQFKADGIAVFHNGRMVGSLQGNDADGVLWLREQMKTTTLTVNIPNRSGQVSCDILRVQSDFDVTMQNGHPMIRASFSPEGDVTENNTKLNLNDPKQITIVEQALSAKVKQTIEGALNKLQHKYDADIVKMGDRVHHAAPKEWQQLVSNWDKEFAKLPVTVDVNVRVRRIGMIGPSPAR